MDKEQQKRISIAILIIAACSILYSWGGVEIKALRRYLMPVVYFISVYGFTRNWKSFVGLPFAIIGLSLGYGSDNLTHKIVKRIYTSGICSLSFGYKQLWALIPMAIITVLGVLNMFPARIEEMTIGFIYTLPLLQIAYKGE